MKSSFVVFISLFLALYLLVHTYLFVRGWQALSNRPALRSAFAVTFIVLALTLLCSLILENKLPIRWSYILNVIGNTWLIALLYFLLFTLFFDIIRVINIRTHFIGGAISENYALTKNLVFAGVVFVVTLLCLGGYIRFSNPSAVSTPIAFEKKTDKTIRIVAASDLHFGYNIREKRVRKFVSFINEQKPDIVVLCGDVIDRSFRPIDNQKLYRALSQIEAPMGVYAIWGNHEYISQMPEKVADFYKKSNVQLLRDESILVDNNLFIIGRDDLSNTKRKPLSELMQDVNPDKLCIVLDHQPSAIQESVDQKIDLQISGHTHNGQVWPINKLVKRLFPLHYGHKQFDDTHVIVTSGLGLWGGLFRIGTQSEIIVLDLPSEE